MFLFQKNIFFVAYKTSGGDFSGEITYDRADINEGAGFDKQTGKFRAPEGGTYYFTFSGMSGKKKSVINVGVHKEGSVQHLIVEGNEADYWNNINSSWMMVLAKGEDVYLKVSYGKLYAHSRVPVIFTGNLLKLDDVWAHPKLSLLQI